MKWNFTKNKGNDADAAGFTQMSLKTLLNRGVFVMHF